MRKKILIIGDAGFIDSNLVSLKNVLIADTKFALLIIFQPRTLKISSFFNKIEFIKLMFNTKPR